VTVGGDGLIVEEPVFAQHSRKSRSGEPGPGLPEEFSSSAATEIRFSHHVTSVID
jgi:hypothetical protein